MKKLLYLSLVVVAAFLGFWMGDDLTLKKNDVPGFLPEKTKNLTDQSVVAKHRFLVAFYGCNDEMWCERAMASVFEQDYENVRVVFVDDASSDMTIEKVQKFIEENDLKERIMLITNQEKLGSAVSLYRAVHEADPDEIVIPLQAKDWLSYRGVIEQLNRSYQGEDVWMSISQALSFPSYMVREAALKDPECFRKMKGVPISFYAALFQRIPLAKLLELQDGYVSALLMMADKKTAFVPHPFVVLNEVKPLQETKVNHSHSLFSPLKSLHTKPRREKEQADLVVFSFDRPMQLYAFLESVQKHVQGMHQCSVIYRASHERFEEGYTKVKEAFPWAHFLTQSDPKKRDFKPLTLQAAFSGKGKYVLFGVDDIIVKDDVDLSKCIEQMEITGAYGVFLRLGKNITYSYQAQQKQKVPVSIPVEPSLFAWQLDHGEADWNFANTLDMTLYRKEDLEKHWRKLKFNSPNGLEFNWANECRPSEKVGLYFAQSKVVNIPLNVVLQTGNPHMNYMSTEELLVKFLEGLKIDIGPLEEVDNSSPHFEFPPVLITR